MALEETVDITCLYAAKNLSQYVILKQPEPVKLAKISMARQGLQDIVEARCKEAYQELSEYMQSLQGDEDKEDSKESEDFARDLCSKAYKKIKSDALDLYKKLRASGLSKVDREEFKGFRKEFGKEYVFMMIASMGEQEMFEAAEESSPHYNEMMEFRKKADKAHENYLASAGINTDVGKAAWVLAHYAGLFFQRAVYHNNNPNNQTSGSMIKIDKNELEGYIQSAVQDGLMCARSNAMIEDSEKLMASSVDWLSKELNNRLSKGLEFNLLDSVYVRKGDDGLIYLKEDKKEPYTIE